MKVITFKNKKEASRKVATEISKIIKKKPNTVLGLATGGTMISLYRELVRLYRKGEIDFSKVRTFNLDEYVGRKFYHDFMKKRFFSKVNISKKNINFPAGSSSMRYDDKIRKAGGVDLQILGIGINGHIGFNEPGAPLGSKTRVVTLSDETRTSNSRFFQSKKDVPGKAVTMGVGTIMKARKIILIAFGKKKADAVVAAVKGRVSEDIPASFLKKHPGVTFVVDRGAARRLG